jgi:hypothetical protein
MIELKVAGNAAIAKGLKDRVLDAIHSRDYTLFPL